MKKLMLVYQIGDFYPVYIEAVSVNILKLHHTTRRRGGGVLPTLVTQGIQV